MTYAVIPSLLTRVICKYPQIQLIYFGFGEVGKWWVIYIWALGKFKVGVFIFGFCGNQQAGWCLRMCVNRQKINVADYLGVSKFWSALRICVCETLN